LRTLVADVGCGRWLRTLVADVGCGRWLRTLVAVGATLVFPAPAQDYSTTNRDRLGHFWSAIESSNRPVTVLSFGDSMADSWRSPTCHLMNKLLGRFGSAGYSLNNYGNTALWNLANGATSRGPDYFWFTSYSQVPAGGAVWWENQPTPGGVLCDRAGIYYVSQTNGGQFRMLISTNGGPWTTALVLNGYNFLPQGYFTNVVLPLNRYRIRVEGDAGTNYIIGPSAVAANTKGIHAAFTDWGGINLGQVTNVPLSIRQPIFAALQPDLIVWHMKEEDNAATGPRMAACETWWSNAAPNCDIIYIGTTWISTDTNSTTTMDENTVTRNTALAYHRTYADLMQPTVSYPWLLTNGFMADQIHVNSAGGLYCANLLWDDLGFFALGLPRTLSLSTAGPQLQLTYATSTGAVYRLEVSTNLQTWSAVFTNPVATATFSTNFTPASPFSYYRLRLTPN